jgi:hypothetical protein
MCKQLFQTLDKPRFLCHNNNMKNQKFQVEKTFNVRLTNGKFLTFTKGQLATAKQVAALPTACRKHFVEVASVGDTVPDAAVLELLLEVHEAGGELPGNFKTVWGVVAASLQVSAPFCQFRGNQLARVGREWERVVGASFATLCPDLPQTAGDWVSTFGLPA